MKKFLATLLALMMLAMPFASVAEAGDYVTQALEAGRRINYQLTVTDVGSVLTGEPAVDKVIADVLNAMVISGYEQGSENYVAISMDQGNGTLADLLTLGVAMMGDDTYINTNLIGSTIVLSEPDVLPVLERLVSLFVMIGLVSENEAYYLMDELAFYWEQVKAEFAATMTGYDVYADVDLESLNYMALDAMVAIVMENATELGEDMEPLPRSCDTATHMVKVELTFGEMVDLVKCLLQFIKDNPVYADIIAAELDFDNAIAPTLGGMTGETVTFIDYIDDMMEQLDALKASVDGVDENAIVVRVWLNGEDECVAADLTVFNYEKDSESGEELYWEEFRVSYSRLSMGNVVVHSGMLTFEGGDVSVDVAINGNRFTGVLSAAENGETKLMATVEYINRSKDNLEAFDLVVDVSVINAVYNSYYYGGGYQEVNTTADMLSFRVACSSDTTLDGIDFVQNASVSVYVDGDHIITVALDMETADPGKSITEGKVLRLAQLSDVDFANWFVSAYTALMSWVQNALYALPTSVINLINSAF